jgi:hypothetical protein
VELEYSKAEIDETVRDAGPESVENLPAGLAVVPVRVVDS